MKTKAYPPFLATCAMLSVPVSAGAATTTFSLSNVTVDNSSSIQVGTLSGTFQFDGTNFPSFHITANMTSMFPNPPNGTVFDTNSTSTPSTSTQINLTDSADTAALTLFLMNPLTTGTVSDPVTGGTVGRIMGGPPESVVGGSVVNAVPLPGALPLFASGLVALGLLALRRKRPAQAAV